MMYELFILFYALQTETGCVRVLWLLLTFMLCPTKQSILQFMSQYRASERNCETVYP